MRRSVLLIGIICVVTSLSNIASANSVDGVVRSCIHETRAPGSYSIVGGGSMPVVAPGAGATQASAAAINDCLLDKYQIQFAAVPAAPATKKATPVRRSEQTQCQRLLNRSGIESFAISATTSVLLGGIGAAAHASTLTANFQNCIRSGAYGSNAPVGRRGVHEHTFNCRAGGGVFQGGTSICPGRGG
ncbi:MAG: hypothetical protein AAGK92_14820 [Pseudomonadota bacterium]